MIISDFTRREVEFILEEANFTDSQKEFFLLRSKGESIETCAEMMDISVSTANALSRKIKDKINKVY